MKLEAQERHRIKSRLPRTAEKVSKKRMKSEMGNLGVEFNSDSDDEVCELRAEWQGVLLSVFDVDE